MFQQSEYDLTNVEVHFKELNDNSGYHVHIVRIQASLSVSRTEHYVLPFRRQSKVIWSFHVKILHCMVIGIHVKLTQKRLHYLRWVLPINTN